MSTKWDIGTPTTMVKRRSCHTLLVSGSFLHGRFLPSDTSETLPVNGEATGATGDEFPCHRALSLLSQAASRLSTEGSANVEITTSDEGSESINFEPSVSCWICWAMLMLMRMNHEGITMMTCK